MDSHYILFITVLGLIIADLTVIYPCHNFSGENKISHILLQALMVSYCIHKSLTLDPLLSKNSTYTITSNFFKMHFHINLLPIPRSPKLFITFGTVIKTCTPVISECLLYVSLISTYLIWFKCEALYTMS
jgi:hypothetical protein